MKALIIAFASSFFLIPGWLTHMDEAKKQAAQENKLILLNFSGSDWCGPCIRMEKDFFENDSFKKMAAEQLILVNADFPRLSKHQLSESQQKENAALASRYNADGIFPCTLLIDASGKVVKRWKGFPNEDVSAFMAEINQALAAR